MRKLRDKKSFPIIVRVSGHLWGNNSSGDQTAQPTGATSTTGAVYIAQAVEVTGSAEENRASRAGQAAPATGKTLPTGEVRKRIG